MRWIILTAIIFAVLLVPSLQRQSSHPLHVIVLVDVTSEHIPLPSFDDLRPFLSVGNIWQEKIVSIGIIHELPESEMKEFHLKYEPWYVRNTLKRRRVVHQFEVDVGNALASLADLKRSRNQSLIFERISHELESVSDDVRLILIVYTDLMENNSQFTAYSQLDDSVLQQQIKSHLDQTRNHSKHTLIIRAGFLNTQEAQQALLIYTHLSAQIESLGGTVRLEIQDEW